MAKPKHYITNKEFTKLLVAYNNDPESKTGKKAYEQIGKVLILLANKIASGGSWRGYTDEIKEEMKAEAIFTMIKNLSKYDHEKYSNPFSYFTTITLNVFYQHMNKLHITMDRYVSFNSLSAAGMEYLIIDDKFGEKTHKPKDEK